jgi:hypothetical protein
MAALTVGACCGFMLTVADAAAAKTTREHRHAQRPTARAARAALVAYLKHSNALDMRAPGTGFSHSNATITADYSFNWSGYLDSSSTTGDFTQVSASWKVPKVTCTPEDQLASDWVGIDGVSDSTVEQDGTTGWCYEGTATYYTWWEMYPTNAEQNVGDTVKPGDVITSTVKRSGQSYTLTVTDATTSGNSFSTTQTCSATCDDTSVEWIAERPSFSIGIAPFVDQGTWKPTSTTEEQTSDTSPQPITAGPNTASITMLDATQAYFLSTPSALGTAGTKFTDVWDNSW